MVRNRQSAKKAGTLFEQKVAEYLQWALNEPRVERRSLSGGKDRGDINGVLHDGKRVVLECKNTSVQNVSKHLREAEVERGNDDATFCAVIQKRRGIGVEKKESMGQQLVMMTLEQYALLLNHGLPLGEEEND